MVSRWHLSTRRPGSPFSRQLPASFCGCPVPSSLLTMTALQLVLCAWRRGNAAVECAFAVHLLVGAVDEVAEPEKIVKISESENRGLWSSCVDASVF